MIQNKESSLIPDSSSEVVVQGPSKNITISNQHPITFMLGLNVLEDESIVETCLEEMARVFSKHKASVIFKASFDKANRSSHLSRRGPGLQEGLLRLKYIRSHYHYPILTDLHTEAQAAPVAEVADILQIPAFLCRQPDLIQAAAETNKPLHIKKMQMLAPYEMKAIIEKCNSFGNEQVILCERGTSFGYGRLILDPLSLAEMKNFTVPISLDVSHALQYPGVGDVQRVCAGGRSSYTLPLAYAGISQGISAVFIECHPQPEQAWCDGACALPLSSLDYVVEHMINLDRFIKAHPPTLVKRET